MEKEQLHKKLDDFLSGSNKEKVDKELFSLLVRMDECRKKALHRIRIVCGNRFAGR